MQSVNNNRRWRIFDYESKYERGVLSLFNVNYPETNLGKKNFFRWQNFQNPSGNSIIKLAINNLDEVVGFYCVMPQLYWINGKKILGSISLNTLVREDYRGMGIFTALAKACYQDCVIRKVYFTLGFPNQNSYPGFVNKLGFTNLGEMPLLIRPVNWLNMLAYKLKLKNKKTPLGLKKTKVKFDGSMFIPKGNGVVRDKKFLNWRLDWPGRNYRVLEKLDGMAVLGIFETGGLSNGLIIDFLGGQSIVTEVNNYFMKAGVDQIGGLFAKNSDEFKTLQKSGYINCPNFLKPQPMRAIVRWHIGNEPEGFYDLNNWQITMLDYDVA